MVRIGALLILAGSSVAWGQTYSERASKPNEEQAAIDPAAVWRQPVALHLTQDRKLVVLCRRSPTMVVVSMDQPESLVTHSIGGRPEAMAALPDGRLVVADSERNRLIVVRLREDGGLDQAEIPVGDEPRVLLASRTKPIVWASLRAGRAVEEVDVDAGRVVQRRELAFPPHAMTTDSKEEWLVVADAFRGRLAVLHPVSLEPIVERNFPGTNIRGVTFTPDDAHLVFAHQIISERSIIERENVRWGAFITNNVRRISTEVLLDPAIDAVSKSELGFVGDFGNGAGDPGRLQWPADGLVLVCYSGVDEVGIDTGWPLRFGRVSVGRRPVDIVADAAGQRAYVANMFDDAISVVDIAKRKVVQSISLGPRAAETPAMRGEVLFHDATLSLDNWYSCQSCHTDGHTNGSNSDTQGDGGFGAPKNTPSLLGVAATRPWSWIGKFDSLEDQIESSLAHTMLSRRTSSQEIADLAAYLATLEPRRGPERGSTDSAEGRKVFERVGCATCHAGDGLTSAEVYDVGLDDGLAGHDKFNPPSLRGVAHTAPYLHDGRAASLEEILDVYQHRLEAPLADADRAALLSYLRSL